MPSVPEPILAVAPGGIDFPAFPVPPDNHLEVFQWSESAMYRVVWFRDRDADGTFTSGDDTNCGDSDSNTVVSSGQGANNWGATYVRATDFMGQHSTIWYQQMGWSGIWYRDQVVGGQIRPNYTQAPWSYQLTVANFGCSG